MITVKFYRGLKAKYNATTHSDGIYFSTDTLEILMNGQCYGGSGLTPEKTVENIAQGSSADKLVVTYTDKTTTELTVGKSTYTSSIVDTTLQMPASVGGLEKGTKVADLNGKSYDSMFDDLLFPTVTPVFSMPSASISLRSGSAIREVGENAPLSSDIATAFNKGAINLNGVKQADRAGELNAATSFIYVNGSKAEKTLPVKMLLGQTSYNYHAEYLDGPQPKDNKGNNFGAPLAAGSIDSNAMSVNGTYPWFATTVDNATQTKQGLIGWNASAGSMSSPKFTLKPSGGGSQIFKLPRKASVLQMENTISGQMEVIGFSAWTESTEVINIGGTDVTYYKYVYNGAARSSVNLIVKF